MILISGWKRVRVCRDGDRVWLRMARMIGKNRKWISAHPFYHMKKQCRFLRIHFTTWKKNVDLCACILPPENCMWISAPIFLTDRVCMQWCLWACVCVCACVRASVCVVDFNASILLHEKTMQIFAHSFYHMKKECGFMRMHFAAWKLYVDFCGHIFDWSCVCVCVRARACVSLYACIHDSDQWVEASACV